MSEQPQKDDEAMREEARKRMEDMPAETALGNRDPEGGGQGDPEEFKGEGN